jgi:hypothetical protein
LSHQLHQPCFVLGIFQDRVSQIICPGWPQTVILLISASQVARVIGISEWCPAKVSDV